jgi:hypothetical protein
MPDHVTCPRCGCAARVGPHHSAHCGQLGRADVCTTCRDADRQPQGEAGDIVRHSLDALIDPDAAGIPTTPDESPRDFLIKVHRSWADDRAAWRLVSALVPLSQESRENLRSTVTMRDRDGDSDGAALEVRAGRIDYACFVAVKLYKELRLASRRSWPSTSTASADDHRRP